MWYLVLIVIHDNLINLKTNLNTTWQNQIVWQVYPRILKSENTHFVRGSITVWLTGCFNGLDTTQQVCPLILLTKQSRQNQICKTGGQSDTSVISYLNLSKIYYLVLRVWADPGLSLLAYSIKSFGRMSAGFKLGSH